MNDLLRGRVSRFSLDALVNCLKAQPFFAKVATGSTLVSGLLAPVVDSMATSQTLVRLLSVDMV